MYRVYIICHTGRIDNHWEYELVLKTDSAGTAWGYAKSYKQSHKKGTLIIGPDGEPLGGF